MLVRICLHRLCMLRKYLAMSTARFMVLIAALVPIDYRENPKLTKRLGEIAVTI